MSELSRSVEEAATKYGKPQRIICELPSLDFPPVSERKHGEVCMAVRRRSGAFLLQTKRSYPNSIMRLPTGGIKAKENVEDALMREIWEETNLNVKVDAFVAEIGYGCGDDISFFKTYMFVCEEIDGTLQSNDPNEQISDWAEAHPEQLTDYAEQLRGIVSSWSDWGQFRAAALDILAAHCASRAA